jgi:hypothetical protein
MSIRRAQDERIEGTPDGLTAVSEIMDFPDAPTPKPTDDKVYYWNEETLSWLEIPTE